MSTECDRLDPGERGVGGESLEIGIFLDGDVTLRVVDRTENLERHTARLGKASAGDLSQRVAQFVGIFGTGPRIGDDEQRGIHSRTVDHTCRSDPVRWFSQPASSDRLTSGWISDVREGRRHGLSRGVCTRAVNFECGPGSQSLVVAAMDCAETPMVVRPDKGMHAPNAARRSETVKGRVSYLW